MDEKENLADANLPTVESRSEKLETNRTIHVEVVKDTDDGRDNPNVTSGGSQLPATMTSNEATTKHENEEILYDFPSFPNLTPEEHRKLSLTACLIFHCADRISVEPRDILRYLMDNSVIHPVTGQPNYYSTYFGPYNTTLVEFLKLPEIACVVLPTKLTDKRDDKAYFKYRSYISLQKYPIHIFRVCVVQCLKIAIEDASLKRKFGAITIETLCDIFNNHPTLLEFFGEKIYDGQVIKCFETLSLMEALCCFCSREIVIRTSSTPQLIRLRNDPDFLCRQITIDEALFAKAIKFYEAYKTKNSAKVFWDKFLIDVCSLNNNDLTYISSYPSFFLDNVYAAVHHSKSTESFPTLYGAITKYTKQPPDVRTFRCLTENVDVNLLIEMVSPEALEAVEHWNVEKKDLYMKIANDLATKFFNQFDRDFVVDFIDVFPVKSPLLATFKIWAFKRMALHVLIVTQQPRFIDENEIVENVRVKFNYNLYQWLEMFETNFDGLFADPEVYCLFKAVVIKNQNGIKFYRNMVSVLQDKNLIRGFPYSTRKRLLNSLEEGILINVDDNGYVTEDLLIRLYEHCYKKKFDEYEKYKLLGSYDGSVQKFLEEYDIKEISMVILGDGQRAYKMNEGFELEYFKVMDEKRKCFDACRSFLGCLQNMQKKKMAGPTSNFTAAKQNGLDYELKKLKQTEMILTTNK